MNDDAEGPVAQSVRIAFVLLNVAIVLAALGWATMNVRQVPPSMQAVVLRFGALDRVRQAGLVAAWPRPFERVVLLPGPDRQAELKVDPATARAPGLNALGGAGDAPESAGGYLTGDGGVVLADATLTWRVTDAAAYLLAQAHVEAALRRAAEAAMVTLASARPLEDFIVTRNAGPATAAAANGRDSLRPDLVRAVNARLAALAQAGAPLGVEVTRADVTAFLPPAARLAFDAVLNAGQMADQAIAAARTGAERARQAGEQDAARLIAEAHAGAAEKVSVARSKTAEATSLAANLTAEARPSLIEQVYRERMAAILRGAGAVTTVDPRGGTRVILPGGPR